MHRDAHLQHISLESPRELFASIRGQMKYLYAIVYAILERCVHASEAKNNSCMQSFLVHPAGILFKHYANMDDDDAIVPCSSSGEPPPLNGEEGVVGRSVRGEGWAWMGT